MGTWKELKERFSYLRHRKRFETELDEEIRFHLDTRIEEFMQAGLTESDATAQARREFGTESRLREDSRGAW